MLDFPASPTDGQQFNAPNGILYQWNAAGSVWLAMGGSTSSATISATPPSNPFVGQLWWSPDLGRLFIYYNDGNSSQWVPASPTAPLLQSVDFFATGTPALGTTAQVFTLASSVGNSGAWYNSANGRFTPPAGRYNLFAMIGGLSNAGAIGIIGQLRKNGTVIGPGSSGSSPAANMWGIVPVTAQVDANGTDYFDFLVSCNPAATGSEGYFGAFMVR